VNCAQPDAFLQIANVGDSTAFLWDGKASLKLTTDHKVTDATERERIVSAGTKAKCLYFSVFILLLLTCL
jgi:serine/threonine protein phosphatase PrpC